MIDILKKSLLWLMVILLILLLISQIHILMFNDISVEPISLNDNLDFKASSPISRPAVYLISYADGPEIFFKNQNALALSSLNKGIDFILNYRRSHLDSGFIQKYQKTLHKKKGVGLWIWKPHIILKTMETVPENSILIYLDVGFSFHGSLKNLLALTKKQDITLAYYPSKADTVQTISTKNVQTLTRCDTEECLNAKHVRSGFLLLRNTPESRAFIQQWLDFCTNDKIIEEDMRLHDEALLSITHYHNPQVSIALPIDEFESYFHLHHRYPKEEFLSLLPRMNKHITGIERDFLNSKFMINLRAYFLPKFFTHIFVTKQARKI